MATTKNSPSIVTEAGKVYSGISFFIPVLLLNLAIPFALSKAVEISNLEKAPTKIPGTTPRLTSSGLFQATSMILGGGIMKPIGWLIADPTKKILGALAPDSPREFDYPVDDKGEDHERPSTQTTPSSAFQLHPQPVSRP